MSATEQDPAAVPTEGERSRAAEVLDRLVAERTAPPRPRRLMRVVAAAVVVVVVTALVLWRRPAPIDERLPITSGPVSTGAEPTGAEPTGATGSTAGTGSSSTSPVGPLVVHVAGAVASPGVVRVAAGGRVVDAVRAAGGLRSDADADRVNLAAPLTDGQRVVVPAVGQEIPAEVLPSGLAAPGAAGPGGRTGSPDVPAGPIDLNAATAEQLDTLPGVGPSTAAAILAHRDESGPFRSVDDLLDVRGIGEAKLEALRDLVVVAP